ncbi:MAG: hypothetical protein Q8K45_15100 [Rubrivivax sp.]|nr:hypothetical protein [Rubrivivax sp.]
MFLPFNATIRAAQSCVLNARAAQEFLEQQDAASADARYRLLIGHLKEARDLLR